MNDIPRSRALVAFDRNGYLLPIEPVTPAGSKAWRIVHFSPVLIVLGMTLFLLSVLAGEVVRVVLGAFGLGMRGFYAVPLIGTALVVANYWVLVRVVERRRAMTELALSGWWWEAGAGVVGGLLFFVAVVAPIMATGGGELLGIGLPP